MKRSRSSRHLAGQGVNLLALNTMPLGPDATQLTLFPEDAPRLRRPPGPPASRSKARTARCSCRARTSSARSPRSTASSTAPGVEVYASNAVTDGRGFYGYVLYMRPQDSEKAAALLDG